MLHEAFRVVLEGNCALERYLMDSILLCGEVNSSNLGDVVIARSTQYILNEVFPEIKVLTCDLSGRTLSEGTSLGLKRGFLRIINRYLLGRSGVYRRALTLALWRLRDCKKITETWQPSMEHVGLIVVGGGQLLMDNSLSFPLKISAFVKLAQKNGTDVYFWGCGVSKLWSRSAKKLFCEALHSATVKSIYLRGQRDCTHLAKHCPGITTKLNASHDSALWAAEAFGASRNEKSRIYGLGVIAPNVLRRAGVSNRFSEVRSALQAWEQIAVVLYDYGKEFLFFTNGAPEDFAFAELAAKQVGNRLGVPSTDLLLGRPRDGAELVSQISAFRAIVAHRLHANIIAYSLGVPSVGLIWDEKVRWFGETTGRSRYFIGDESSVSVLVVERLLKADERGVDLGKLKAMKLDVMDDMIRMLRDFKEGNYGRD